MKIYKVDFVEYTNATKRTVTDGKRYFDVPKEGFLIIESELEFFKKCWRWF